MSTKIASTNEGVKLTGFSFLAFLCGATFYYKFSIIGEIYLAEILLWCTSLLILVFGKGLALLRRPVFLSLLMLAVLALAAYMFSDLYRGTAPSQYMRGWGRWVLFIGDLIALSILAGNHKRNLWWFAFGVGIGGIIFFMIDGQPLSQWKFGYGVPVTFAVICLSFLLSARLASLVVLALSMLSIGFDFRSLGGQTLAVSILLWARSRRPGQAVLRLRQLWGLVAVAVFGGMLLYGALMVTREGTEIHRDLSDAGRLSAVKVALIAIGESPLIGWGSWTVNEKFAQMEMKGYAAVVEQHGGEARAGRLFSPHSQLLQVWVEGGLLAAIFCFYYGYRLILGLKYMLLARPLDAYTPIFFLVLMSAFWDLLASPFLGFTRMTVALAVAIICVMTAERAASFENARSANKPVNHSAGRKKTM